MKTFTIFQGDEAVTQIEAEYFRVSPGFVEFLADGDVIACFYDVRRVIKVGSLVV